MKQRLLEYRTNIAGCDACAWHAVTALFQLCAHPSSVYHGDEHHTCQHMREQHVGLCGAERKLMVKK